jgi:hypothetical protein
MILGKHTSYLLYLPHFSIYHLLATKDSIFENQRDPWIFLVRNIKLGKVELKTRLTWLTEGDTGCVQWVFEPNSLETSLIIVPLSENSLVKIIAAISLNFHWIGINLDYFLWWFERFFIFDKKHISIESLKLLNLLNKSDIHVVDCKLISSHKNTLIEALLTGSQNPWPGFHQRCNLRLLIVFPHNSATQLLLFLWCSRSYTKYWSNITVVIIFSLVKK